ncbi:MAG: hypothetical protein FJ137_17785 [Deltaproteobacteria bacterium]|nr:hypothetical protein [Deltaproteobacteria bacterium]
MHAHLAVVAALCAALFAVLAASACGGLALKPDESLAPASVTVTRVDRPTKNATGKTVTAYLVLDKPFAGAVEMRLFDRDDDKGVEVGRQTVVVDEPAGAHYVDFQFDSRTPVFAAAAVQVRALPGPSTVGAAGNVDTEAPTDGGVPANGGVPAAPAPAAGGVDAGT